MPRRLLRFSLLSFLLVVTVICLSVSHYRVTRENRQLKQENDQFKEELGFLRIEHPEKVYVRRLESVEELTWRFRVYFPPEKRFMLYTRAHPRSSGGHGLPKYDQQFTLTLSLQRRADGQWRLKTMLPNSSGDLNSDAEVVERISHSILPLGVRDRPQEFNPDQPIDLVRLLDGDFHVWLEPFTPGKPALPKNPTQKKR